MFTIDLKDLGPKNIVIGSGVVGYATTLVYKNKTFSRAIKIKPFLVL